MKHLLLFPLIAFLLAFETSHAQQVQLPLPTATYLPHYLLPIGFNTTTVLVFPAAVRPVDRGDKDVLAQKQPGLENVLKLKAARKGFPETNLHVFTADGKIYAFNVVYTDSLASTNDLTRLMPPVEGSPSAPLAILSGEALNTDQMGAYVTKMAAAPRDHHAPSDKKSQMLLRLDGVGLAGPLVLFKLYIANRSHMDFNIDFIRLYVRDRQKAKRTSVQEREIIPVYEDLVSTVPGDSAITHILAIPALTLASGKQFVLETYEKNGGRNLTLYIKNKSLLHARKL